MAFSIWPLSAACSVFSLSAAVVSGQQPQTPIAQPGAPGESSKIISPANAAVPRRAPAEADTGFMQGMIHHHSQAVEMTDLMRTRCHNKDLLALGKRISISQTDEIKY